MSKRIYTHKHHIIPRHAGGSNDPSNLVELTTEEHALAHKKLFFIYGRWQDELAYLALEKQIGKEEATKTAREKGYYHWLNNGGRELLRHGKGGGKGGGKGSGRPAGWKMSEEQKQVLREYAQKQVRKPCSEATKEKLRKARKKQVIIRSEETKEKIRQSLLRRNAKV